MGVVSNLNELGTPKNAILEGGVHTKPTCGENNESTDFPLYNYVFFYTADPVGSVLRV